jgi:hypothetical protein
VFLSVNSNWLLCEARWLVVLASAPASAPSTPASASSAPSAPPAPASAPSAPASAPDSAPSAPASASSEPASTASAFASASSARTGCQRCWCGQLETECWGMNYGGRVLLDAVGCSGQISSPSEAASWAGIFPALIALSFGKQRGQGSSGCHGLWYCGLR